MCCNVIMNACCVGIATRLCNSNRQWNVPVVTNCLSHEYRQLLKLVERVSLYVATVYTDFGNYYTG